jgi:hypothetical protein
MPGRFSDVTSRVWSIVRCLGNYMLAQESSSADLNRRESVVMSAKEPATSIG